MSKHFGALFALTFVIFIDSLGLAIIFPMLEPIFLNVKESILADNASLSLRNLYYGVTLGIFPLALFFSAPVLGDLSDKVGRKKVLLLSLVGACISYGLSAVSIWEKSVMLLLMSRLIAGLTAGSQPIAQAAIIDISHPERKAHNLSLVIFASSLGWIGGPLIGGFLSDATVLPWFSPSLALGVAALLSFLNVLVLQFSFREMRAHKKKEKRIYLHKGPIEFFSAFQATHLRRLSWIFTFMEIGWGFYFQFIALFMASRMQMDTHSIGIFLALIAVGFASTTFLIKPVTKYFSLHSSCASFLGLAGIAFLITCAAERKDIVLLGFDAVVVGLSIGISYTLLMTLYSNRTRVDDQGRIMGVTLAIAAMMWFLSSLIGGFLVNYSIYIPLLLSGIFLLASSAMMLFERSFKTSA